MGDQDHGASLRDRAGQASPGAATASPPSGDHPSRDDLSTKTPQQIGRFMAGLTEFISAWTPVVVQAEESARRDRELLSGAMAELTSLAHYVARGGAIALEGQPPCPPCDDCGAEMVQTAHDTWECGVACPASCGGVAHCDSDGSPKGEDADAASFTTARADEDGIAKGGSHDH